MKVKETEGKKSAETKERKPKDPHNDFMFETPKIPWIKNGINHFVKTTIHTLKCRMNEKEMLCQIQTKSLKWELKAARNWNEKKKRKQIAWKET